MSPRYRSRHGRAAALCLYALLAAGCGGSGTSATDAAPSDALLLVDAGADAGPAVTCGGRGGATCKQDEYCDFPDDQCGSNDRPGVCRPRPGLCPPLYAPACGCDGQVHGSDCGAMSEGQDISALGGCQPPSGYFACGSVFCMEDAEYCQRTTADVAGTADAYACRALPAACSTRPSCDCVASEPCAADCNDVQGNLTLTCPGG